MSEVMSSEIDMKKKEKEIPVVYDAGYFVHDTGDVYDGNFEAKKKDRYLRMHGAGVYTTAEGDIYKGTWEGDKLVSMTAGQEEVEIKYTDGSTYKGRFREWCYTSKGTYTYPDESVLSCEFVENAPTGKLQLTDPNGHIWLGKSGQGFGWVNPANHYYDMLEVTRDPNRMRKKKRPIDTGPSKITSAKSSMKAGRNTPSSASPKK